MIALVVSSGNSSDSDSSFKTFDVIVFILSLDLLLSLASAS